MAVWNKNQANLMEVSAFAGKWERELTGQNDKYKLVSMMAQVADVKSSLVSVHRMLQGRPSCPLRARQLLCEAHHNQGAHGYRTAKWRL